MNDTQLEQEFRELSRQVITSHGYKAQELITLIAEEQSIPVSVFSSTTSPLQALVSYLKDQQNMDFTHIANTLHRSYRAVWGAYQHNTPTPPHSNTHIPLRIFNDNLSILESVVNYLKEEHKLKLSHIARLLGKDQRTIWTIHNRAHKKMRGDTQ